MKLRIYSSLIILCSLGLSIPCIGSSAVKEVPEEKPEIKRVTKDDLLALISENTQDEKVLEFSRKLLNGFYETAPRFIKSVEKEEVSLGSLTLVTAKDKTSKYGRAFPINPEILADLMKQCKGKTVLEIAAANGENSLLLGLAGAEKVYVNDIEPCELDIFARHLQALPEDMQTTFQMVLGDCFTVFEKEEYSEKFDLIYTRNFFHLFAGEKRDQLITLAHRLLKPGGRLVISVNSAQYALNDIQILKEHPEAYAFKRQQVLLRTPGRNVPVNGLGSLEVETDLSIVNPLEYRFIPVITFPPNEITYHDITKEFPQAWQNTIKTMANGLTRTRETRKQGVHIDCHRTHIICYTRHTLEKAFEGDSFNLVEFISTGEKGHITTENKEAFLNAVFEKN